MGRGRNLVRQRIDPQGRNVCPKGSQTPQSSEPQITSSLVKGGPPPGCENEVGLGVLTAPQELNRLGEDTEPYHSGNNYCGSFRIDKNCFIAGDRTLFFL